MIVVDVNVLVNAFRTESPDHALARSIIEEAVNGDEPVAMPTLVLSGFLRVVTHPRVFAPPTPVLDAIAVTEKLLAYPNVVATEPGPRHWQIFTRLCVSCDARGNLVPDAYLAAIAIEQGARFISFDGDFARFPGLRWQHPRSG